MDVDVRKEPSGSFEYHNLFYLFSGFFCCFSSFLKVSVGESEFVKMQIKGMEWQKFGKVNEDKQKDEYKDKGCTWDGLDVGKSFLAIEMLVYP